MTVEISGFIGLAVLAVGLFAWQRQDMRILRGEMRQLGERVNTRFERLETRLAAVEHGLAKLGRAARGHRGARAAGRRGVTRPRRAALASTGGGNESCVY